MTWVRAVRSSSSGYDVLEQRHRPAVDDDHDERDRRDLHGLRDLRHGVDVDPAGEELALELARQGLEVVGQLRALGHPRPREEHQQHRRGHRRLDDGLEVLLRDLDGSTPSGARPGRPAGPAAGAPAGADPAGPGAPFRPERSIAPGRLNGCCVMRPILGGRVRHAFRGLCRAIRLTSPGVAVRSGRARGTRPTPPAGRRRSPRGWPRRGRPRASTRSCSRRSARPRPSGRPRRGRRRRRASYDAR